MNTLTKITLMIIDVTFGNIFLKKIPPFYPTIIYKAYTMLIHSLFS